jgi:hypothetical protein
MFVKPKADIMKVLTNYTDANCRVTVSNNDYGAVAFTTHNIRTSQIGMRLEPL